MDPRTDLHLDHHHIEARITAFEREAAEIRAARHLFATTRASRPTRPVEAAYQPTGITTRATSVPQRWLRWTHALRRGPLETRSSHP